MSDTNERAASKQPKDSFDIPEIAQGFAIPCGADRCRRCNTCVVNGKGAPSSYGFTGLQASAYRYGTGAKADR